MKHRIGRTHAALGMGFTLIELLVVIAVIAIVAAILFPVFAQAREAARKTTCASNLKQIGTAVQMYAQDFEELLPSSGTRSGTDLAGLLNPYIKQAKGRGIWRCPSQGQFPTDGSWTSSYGYNWEYLLAPGPDYPHTASGARWSGFANAGLPLAALARPADTLMFIDQDVLRSNGTGRLWTYVLRPSQPVSDPDSLDGMGLPAFRHHNRANVLFCEGHVKSVPPSFADITAERSYWDTR